jgi:hypothetical protein
VQKGLLDKFLVLDCAVRLTLSPFNKDELKEFVAGVAGTKSVDSNIIDLLIEQTDGSECEPEKLVQSLTPLLSSALMLIFSESQWRYTWIKR